MAREPIAGLVVPSQLDEGEMAAELELEIPDSGQEPLLTDLGDEIEIIEEENGDVIVDFDPMEDMPEGGFDENLAETLDPVAWVFDQHRSHQIDEGRGQVWTQIRQAWGRSGQNGGQDFSRRLAGEWALAAQHLKEQDP